MGFAFIILHSSLAIQNPVSISVHSVAPRLQPLDGRRQDRLLTSPGQFLDGTQSLLGALQPPLLGQQWPWGGRGREWGDATTSQGMPGASRS